MIWLIAIIGGVVGLWFGWDVHPWVNGQNDTAHVFATLGWAVLGFFTAGGVAASVLPEEN